jgi:hypothetical protein
MTKEEFINNFTEEKKLMYLIESDVIKCGHSTELSGKNIAEITDFIFDYKHNVSSLDVSTFDMLGNVFFKVRFPISRKVIIEHGDMFGFQKHFCFCCIVGYSGDMIDGDNALKSAIDRDDNFDVFMDFYRPEWASPDSDEFSQCINVLYELLKYEEDEH